MEVQEKLAVWTCADDASLLAAGPSPSAVEAPAEIPLASVPSLVQWICRLTCAPYLGACPIQCDQLYLFQKKVSSASKELPHLKAIGGQE